MTGRTRCNSAILGAIVARCLVELNGAHSGLAAAAILLGVERHLLALAKTRDARALERRSVNENVVAAVIGSDEAEAFLLVVEFHCAFVQGTVL